MRATTTGREGSTRPAPRRRTRWAPGSGRIRRAPIACCALPRCARATCERALATLGSACEIRIDPRIYGATPASLVGLLDEQPDSACLLLVGHNPGLESLLALLSDGASDTGRGMPPAAVAWLALADGALEPGTAEVRHFWWP